MVYKLRIPILMGFYPELFHLQKGEEDYYIVNSSFVCTPGSGRSFTAEDLAHWGHNWKKF